MICNIQKVATIRLSISPHLPLDGDIPAINVQRYLRKLFPEGETLDILLTRFQLSKANTFGIIRLLGMDTSGLFLFHPADKPLTQSSSFRMITEAEIENRLDNREAYSLIIWDEKPRLSTAGVQDKINVVINSKGQMGFGEGKLASTHILKFENKKATTLGHQ